MKYSEQVILYAVNVHHTNISYTNEVPVCKASIIICQGEPRQLYLPSIPYSLIYIYLYCTMYRGNIRSSKASSLQYRLLGCPKTIEIQKCQNITIYYHYVLQNIVKIIIEKVNMYRGNIRSKVGEQETLETFTQFLVSRAKVNLYTVPCLQS